MPIGNSSSASISTLNAQIGELAVRWHDVASASQEFFGSVNKLGLAGLEAIGFTQPDAQRFLDQANSMNTSGGIWFGQLAQTPPFNFDDSTAEARGPQAG